MARPKLPDDERRTEVLQLRLSKAERETLRRLTAAAGVAMASANRLAASERAAAETSRELALITEMSREIPSTLDLGGRYKFMVGKSPMTLRALLTNVTNRYDLLLEGPDSYVPLDQRAINVSLAMDF